MMLQIGSGCMRMKLSGFSSNRYESIESSLLEVDGKNVFGNISRHAKFKYLLYATHRTVSVAS